MVKIHSIKCPQCGSPEKIETKENYYQCTSCETEYFVETNEVHHYHYEVKNEPKSSGVNIWKFVAIILTLALLIYASQDKETTKSTALSTSKKASLSAQEKTEKASWRNIHDTQIILNKKNEPILLLIGHYVSNSRDLDNRPIDVQFTNLHTKKKGQIQQLPDFDPKSASSNIEIRRFKTGEYYAVQNEKMAYLIDTKSQRFLPINNDFAKQQPELSKGIIKIKFSHRYGDGFDVMLPNGKTYLYFPYTNRLTNDDTAFSYVYNPTQNKAPKDAPEITTVDFTSSLFFGRDIAMNKNDKIKLVEYTQKTPYGYPMIKPAFYDLMKKDRGVPNFLSKKDRDDARITKWRDITPERDYFAPALFCHNNQYAFISFSENVLADSTRYVQLLNLKTGNPIWTREYKLGKQSVQFMKLRCQIDKKGTTYIADINNGNLTIIDINGDNL